MEGGISPLFGGTEEMTGRVKKLRRLRRASN